MVPLHWGARGPVDLERGIVDAGATPTTANLVQPAPSLRDTNDEVARRHRLQELGLFCHVTDLGHLDLFFVRRVPLVYQCHRWRLWLLVDLLGLQAGQLRLGRVSGTPLAQQVGL